MATRTELKSLPRNLFEWSDAFNDDLGFEPTRVGTPTMEPAGSPGKIATIVERINRGQSIWHVDDAREQLPEDSEFAEVKINCPDVDTYSVAGSENYGAVVGVDAGGSKHRYAIWKRQPSALKRPVRLLYVTETAGLSDSITADKELAAIQRHASLHGACFFAVVSLFTARVAGPWDLAKLDYPVTSISLLWARWLSKHCDKVVACWGRDDRLGRAVDMLWMLSRTAVGGQVHVVREGSTYPPKITVQNSQGLYRFEFGRLIADKVDEEGVGDDENTGD